MTDGNAKSMTLLEWGTLLVLSIFWGGSFLFVGIAVNDFQPLSIAFIRVAIATGVLWLVLIAMGVAIPRKPGLWGSFFIIGAINSAIPFSLMAWGQSLIASGVASILIATTPLIAVVAAHFLTSDERMTVNRFAGVVSGLLGVAVLIGPEALKAIGDGLLGQGLIILAAILYALSSLYGRRFSRQGVSPLVVACGQVSTSTIMLLPLVLVFDQPWQLDAPRPVAWLAIGALGLVSTATAYILYFRVLATAGATNLMLVNLLVPVTAIILGILVLGEILLIQHVVGMLFIAGGLALIDGRIAAMFRRRA